MRSKLLGILLFVAIVAAIFASILGGCTQGQMTPDKIKVNVYGARADAIATVEELDKSPLPPADAEPAVVIEYWKNQAQLARKSLINIGGTAEHYYDDGFLGPVYRWLTATKPQWIKEAD